METRLAALEELMAASGHVVAEGAGLWGRLQRAERAAWMDPNGGGALSRAGLVEAMADISPPYAIAFVDLDHLRDFNAATGNWKAGGAALAALVRILRAASPDAVVPRWGGDEFYTVLPGLDGPAHVTDSHARSTHAATRSESATSRSRSPPVWLQCRPARDGTPSLLRRQPHSARGFAHDRRRFGSVTPEVRCGTAPAAWRGGRARRSRG